jgi:hypothetical protein
MAPFKVSANSVVIMLLLSSIEQVYQQMVYSTPCLSAACAVTSEGVLSKAPSVKEGP